MRFRAIALIGLALAGPGAQVGVAAPSAQQLEAMVRRRACERPEPGHVVYAGDSEGLGNCLRKLGVKDIAELRITSRGGNAEASLSLARELLDRVDLLVVDGMCGSSCANYFIPMARRVRVTPNSYVILHGAITPDIPGDQVERLRGDLTRQLREYNAQQQKKITEQEITWKVNGAIASFRDNLKKAVPVQAQFARERLRCPDWLNPNVHLVSKPIPPQYGYLVVTPVMAYRCLQVTEVDAWWPPEAQEELDLLRARR